ncbi:hypothetical protein ACFXPY_46070 [Streptomyces sp. NPDC059153]
MTGERRRNDRSGERIVAGRLDDRAALIDRRARVPHSLGSGVPAHQR